jgi:cytochrome c oxidase subunit 3
MEAGMSSSTTHSAHHWEYSGAPIAVVFGIFLVLPLTFSSYFVYESRLLAAIFAGLGTPLLLYGIAKWVDEGLTHKPLVAGLAGAGLPVFIVSEIFVFLALFATYWTMRLSAGAWPPDGTPVMPTALPLIMTILLVSSSVTIHVAEDRLHENNLPGFRQWLVITLGLGTLFLGCTIYEYSHLAAVGFIPSTNSFSSAFFGITGFHAAHVALGLGAFVFVLIPALKGKTNQTFVNCVGVYWHFVDIVWFFVVSQIYFW